MATRTDKKNKLPKTDATGSNSSVKDTSTKPTRGTTKDTYDPVGMAGKKAGKVVQIEEQLQQGSADKKAPAGERGGKGRS
jgi:hypothetical protein